MRTVVMSNTVDEGYAAMMARRLRWRRLVTACLAVALSLAAHVFLALKLPHLRLPGTQPVTPFPTERDYPTFQVEIERDQWKQTLREMEILRFEEPVVTADAVDEQAPVDLQPLDPAIFESDRTPESLMAETAQIDVEETRDTVSSIEMGPGQEILAITERIAEIPPETLRRPLTPMVERTAMASDVVIPSVEAELASRPRDVRLPDPVTESPDGIWRRGFGPIVDRSDAESAAPADVGRLTDDVLSRTMDMPVTTDVSVDAIERHLAADVRLYRSPRDRRYVYFEILIRRHDDEHDDPFLDVLPKDLLFIQDLSGSMGERRVDACREGIRTALRHLSGHDRFNVISFSQDVRQLSDDWIPAGEQTSPRVTTFLDAMVSAGMTDIQKALQRVLDLDRDPRRPMLALLLTDGLPPNVGETNVTRIIENFTVSNRGARSMYAASTGWWDRDAKMYFLDMLTYRNRGEARIVDSGREEIPFLIEAMSQGFSRPILTDLRYRFNRASDSDVYPALLPNLYLDRSLVMVGRMPADRENFAFQVVGRSGDRLHDFVFSLALDEIPEGDETIRRQWARHRIYYLIGEHMRTEDSRTLRDLFDTANRYGLEIPYLDDFSPPRRIPWR